MENLSYNNYDVLNKIKYSFIIYNSNINILSICDSFKKIYINNNFEIIILNEEILKIEDNIDLNNFNFKITCIDIKNTNYNINKYYNYAISLSVGDIIIFQYSECIHIDNILESINNYDFIDNIYTAHILKLMSNNENNFILDNINNNCNSNDLLKKYREHYKTNFINENIGILNRNIIYNRNNKNNNNNNNNKFYFLIIHRKNLDIINGFDEETNNFNFNNFYNKIINICNLKYINFTILNLYRENFDQHTILGDIVRNKYFIQENDIINNICYKRREYKTGIAITIFSDHQTPKGRIEASKIFINSLIENIKTTPIIFLIDYDIIDDHYHYLIQKVKECNNIKIYKNIQNYGISKSKNICIKLLEEIGIDYICLLDDDILIKKDFTDYISNVFGSINISLLANIDKKYKKEDILIKNINFNITSPLHYYGNFICINRYYIDKYGYNIIFPYKYGLEHIEFTERYLSTSRYKNHCLDLHNYFDDIIIIDNVSQFAIHSIIINNKKIKENHRIMNIAIRNSKYISYDFNRAEVIEIIV